MNTPIVWMMQEPLDSGRADLSTVVGLGELRPLFDRNPTPSVDPDRALDIARDRLQDARDGDYFVDMPGCDPVCAFLAGIALAESACYEGGPVEVNWLRWDRRTDASGQRTKHGYYTPVPIQVSKEGIDDDI